MWAFVVSPSFVLALRVLGISSFKLKNQHFQIQRDLQSGYEEAAYVCVCVFVVVIFKYLLHIQLSSKRIPTNPEAVMMYSVAEVLKK